jgi:hypothetical protein
MQHLHSSHHVVQDLMKLLGVPASARSFELRCAVGGLVTVTCEYYPLLNGVPSVDGDKFKTAWATYGFIPSNPVQAEVSICGGRSFDAWMRERIDAAHQRYMDHWRYAKYTCG